MHPLAVLNLYGVSITGHLCQGRVLRSIRMVPVLRFKALWPRLEGKKLSTLAEAMFLPSLSGPGLGDGEMPFSS